MMNVEISEEMSVDAPVTRYVISLSFHSVFLSLSLFRSVKLSSPTHFSFSFKPFCFFCLTHTEQTPAQCYTQKARYTAAHSYRPSSCNKYYTTVIFSPLRTFFNTKASCYAFAKLILFNIILLLQSLRC